MQAKPFSSQNKNESLRFAQSYYMVARHSQREWRILRILVRPTDKMLHDFIHLHRMLTVSITERRLRWLGHFLLYTTRVEKNYLLNPMIDDQKQSQLRLGSIQLAKIWNIWVDQQYMYSENEIRNGFYYYQRRHRRTTWNRLSQHNQSNQGESC